MKWWKRPICWFMGHRWSWSWYGGMDSEEKFDWDHGVCMRCGYEGKVERNKPFEL